MREEINRKIYTSAATPVEADNKRSREIMGNFKWEFFIVPRDLKIEPIDRCASFEYNFQE